MRGRDATVDEARLRREERTGAHAGDVTRPFRLAADEVERLGIVEQRVHAGAAGKIDRYDGRFRRAALASRQQSRRAHGRNEFASVDHVLVLLICVSKISADFAQKTRFRTLGDFTMAFLVTLPQPGAAPP